jgi:hypothetical protein
MTVLPERLLKPHESQWKVMKLVLAYPVLTRRKIAAPKNE